MAEETVNSLVKCEKNKSDGSSSGETSIRKPSSSYNAGGILSRSNRISSDSCHDLNSSRRNSIGKASSQNSNKKIVPNYLRASTGSCHDFCKYGHRHAFEEKERNPFQKSSIRTPSVKQNPAVTVSSGERKKETVLKGMVSPNMKSHALKHRALPGAINMADPPEIIKMLPSENVEVSPKCDALSHNKMSKAGKRVNNFSNKHSSSSQPHPTKQSSFSQTLVCVKKVEKDENTINLSLKPSPSVGQHPSAKKAAKAEKARNDLSQETSVSVGQQLAVSKSSLSFRSPQSIDGSGKQKGDMKSSRNMAVTRASGNKVFGTATASLSPKTCMNMNITRKAKKNTSIKVVSALKEQNRLQKGKMKKTNGEEVPEKTLHAIVAETKDDIAESTEDSDVVSSLTLKSLSQPLSPSLHVIVAETKKDIAESTEDCDVASSLTSQSVPSPKSLSPPLSPSFHVIEAESKNEIAESTEDNDVVSSLAPQSVPPPKSLSRPLSPSLHVIMAETKNDIAESTEDSDVLSLAPQSVPSPNPLSDPQSPSLHVIAAETKNDIAESTEDSDEVSSLAPQSVPSPNPLSDPLSPSLHVIVAETKNDIAESTEDSDEVSSLSPESVPSPNPLSHPLSPSLSSDEEREEEEEDIIGDDVGSGCGDDVDNEEEEEEFEVYDDEEEEVESEIGHSCETKGEFWKTNEMANNDNLEAVEGNVRKTLQKGIMFSETEDSRPVKLKFKRGKVVDLQSENNGPRRLRFRRGRVMEEHDQKGETRRRNLKKKGPDGDRNGTNLHNEKVVLRHQDMQGRKDGQGLFNNVIEETASKLVESRKSKVKALVGAFETVISLQDAKPSPQTVS